MWHNATVEICAELLKKQTVSLCFVNEAGVRLQLPLYKPSTFNIAMRNYVLRSNAHNNHLRFSFKSRILNSNETPEDMSIRPSDPMHIS